jgi:fatty-acyl-CoA synthase
MADVIEKTIGDVLDEAAGKYPHSDAVVFVDKGVRYSYAEFKEVCDRAARGFMAMGVGKGDNVAIWATNHPEWVITQFATAKIGAVMVTVNPAYRTGELEYLLQQSDANTILLIESFKTSRYVEMLNEVCPELAGSVPGELNSEKYPKLKNAVFLGSEGKPGMYTWNQLLEMGDDIPQEELESRQASLDIHDVINMQYTSGTTGFPKGAMLTHYNLVNNAYAVGGCLNYTHEDRICIPVPFYHCFGCVLGTLCAVVYGATMVIASESFEPEPVLKAVAQERCTSLYGVPTMWIAELEHPNFDNYDLSSLRTGIMAGAPCPIEVMKQVVERMGAREITIAYGQTECSPVVTMTRIDDPIEVRVTTVGRPLPGIDVKVVDPETGDEAPAGTQGELCSRGYQVMKGYYKMPDKTEETIDEDGWLHSGDLAVATEEGYLKITGRLKEMIIRGGENIYPREIEEFFYTNDKVSDVQVVGVPSEKFGEEVMACIKLKEGETATEEELREFCKGRIAHFKVPRYIVLMDDFPMTVTGKIQKFKLRDMAIEKFGLQKAAATETA